MATTEERPALSLAEHVVLGLIADGVIGGPTHGFAIASLTDGIDGLGAVYRVRRPIVYRAIGRLTDADLVRAAGVQSGHRGPQRTLLAATAAGRRSDAAWRAEPVTHIRDVRTELLVKLALNERRGVDSAALVRQTRDSLTPIVAALGDQLAAADGFDRVLLTWRHTTARATVEFLDRVENE